MAQRIRQYLLICAFSLLVTSASIFYLVQPAKRYVHRSECGQKERYSRIGRETKFNRVVESIKHLASVSRRSHLHEFALQRLLTMDLVPPHFSDDGVESDNFWTLRTAAAGSLSADDIVVLMMGSSVNLARSELMSSTWLRMLPNSFIFSDVGNVSSVPLMMTLSELAGKQSYEDAQRRQLEGMRWIRANRPTLLAKRWFLFAEDDTWVNVPALLHSFYSYNEAMPLAFGYVWDQTWVPGWATLSGGAAIVLSREAFSIISKEIYGSQPLCQTSWPSSYDVTLSRCLYANQVLKVHSNEFDWHDTQEQPNDYANMIGVHYVRDEQKVRRMTCDAIAFWKYSGRGVPSDCKPDECSRKCVVLEIFPQLVIAIGLVVFIIRLFVAHTKHVVQTA